MATAKPHKKQGVKGDTWPGAFKAIGLKAVEKGQLISFGLLVVAGILAFRLDSDGVVQILSLLLKSRLFVVLGWGLFIATGVGLTYLLKAQRTFYLSEIERLSEERNRLQSSACERISPSGYGE